MASFHSIFWKKEKKMKFYEKRIPFLDFDTSNLRNIKCCQSLKRDTRSAGTVFFTQTNVALHENAGSSGSGAANAVHDRIIEKVFS